MDPLNIFIVAKPHSKQLVQMLKISLQAQCEWGKAGNRCRLAEPKACFCLVLLGKEGRWLTPTMVPWCALLNLFCFASTDVSLVGPVTVGNPDTWSSNKSSNPVDQLLEWQTRMQPSRAQSTLQSGINLVSGLLKAWPISQSSSPAGRISAAFSYHIATILLINCNAICGVLQLSDFKKNNFI